MITSVKSWLQSPQFDNYEKTLVALYLNLSLLTIISGLIAFIVILPFISTRGQDHIANLLLSLVFAIFVKVLLNLKRLKLAQITFLCLAWVAVTIAPMTDVGVYSPSMAGFVLVILFSGLFTSPNAPIYATFMCIASAIVISGMMNVGVIPTVPDHPLTIETALVAYSLIYLVVGAVTYISSSIIFRTIWQLRESQQEATQTNNHLKRAETIAQIGNFEFDIVNQQVKWSDQMYRIFGVEVGKPITIEFYGSLIAEEVYESVMASVQHTVETGSPYHIEHPIILPDGTRKEVYAIGNPVLDDNGRVTKIFGVVQDITERKRAERIKQVLLNISSMRQTTDDLASLLELIVQQLGTVINIKNCYVALYDEDTGYYSFPYGTDEHDDDWSPQKMDRSLTDYVRRTGVAQLITEAKHLQMMAQVDVEFFGTWSKVWVGAPLKVQQRVIGVLAVQSYDDGDAYQQSDLDLLTYVCENVASMIESKRAEEEHIALELQMQKNEFLQEFISHMTHDIKTPLSVIKNSTYLLKNVKDATRQIEFIERIDYQLERLDRIVEDILTISRLDHLDQSSQTTIRLHELLEHISNQLSPKIQLNQMILQLDVADNLPSFMGNESDLTRAFLNLVENAIHYSESESTVVVTAYLDSDDIVCKVRDEGIGIPSDDLPYVFDRFYRADNARDFERGTGLGLAIVKRVFELHHGTIDVRSAEGEGTTFTVRLRIKELASRHNLTQLQPES